MSFDGDTYEAGSDKARLTVQLAAVKAIMLDGRWHRLAEILAHIGHGSEAGVSARIRDLRKTKFGGHTVERRRVKPIVRGLHEYRLVVPGAPDSQTKLPLDERNGASRKGRGK